MAAVVLTAFREVEDAMANGQLLAQRLPLDKSQVQDRSEAVDAWRRDSAQFATTVGAQVPVANVIGQDKNDIGLLRLRG